ncbi:MAG: carboxylating nicotinate-nucleotide diphosphorylase [Candidatus Nanopelagicales bacterium]|jgi:nicotinate-nucleotide pyrophosphorylase (carboxylating)
MKYPTYRLSQDTASGLADAGLSPLDVESLALRAIEEDIGDGVDVTTMATVPLEQRGRLDFVARASGVVAGQVVAAAIFDVVCGEDRELTFHVDEGARVEADTVIMSASALTHHLLRAERPALNLLGHLSGVATVTAAWVQAARGTGAAIRDTRKTTPGMRAVEKYAVRMGGGSNHRMSLSDAALVKDNHVLAAGGVAEAFAAVREKFPDVPVEVEVDSLDQLDEVVAAGADLVLLDNFTVEEMVEAVRRTAGRVGLEASGGLTLDRAAQVAATGVDYLAVGALTHSAAVLDIGADLHVIDEE